MPPEHPSSLPEKHRDFLDQIVHRLSRDPRLVGVAAGGSYLTDTMDAFSDLDLVVAVEPRARGRGERRPSADRRLTGSAAGGLHR